MRFKRKKLKEFASEVKGKKNVYCFGAGNTLTKFLYRNQEYQLEDEIKCIVDNSKRKQGTAVYAMNKDIPVISPKQMLREIVFGDILLITSVYYLEIIELLDKEEKLKNTECYLYSALETEQYDYDRLNIAIPKKLSVYQEQRIPKVIHYCWFGGKPIPDQYKLWMESWKKYCPDYEIVEWNETNYDVKKNKYMRQAYEMEKWAFVSDYARIDIVNEYGGIYLDTDVELIKNIDEMLMNDAFCGFECCQYVAFGLGFGAKRHHPIVNEIQDYYNKISFVSEDGTLNQENCTIIQTEVMKRHGLTENGEFQIVGGMTVYPSRILCGMSPYSFRLDRNLKDTYAIHHFTGSWVDNEQWKNDMIFYIKKCDNSNLYYYPDREVTIENN